MQNKWIKQANLKEGALSKSLGIPLNKNIPCVLLDKIVTAKPGNKIINPSKTGYRIIRVTKKMERRAIAARNLKKIIRVRKRKFYRK